MTTDRTPTMNLSEILSVTWGPSPVEPINLISVEFDDGIQSWECSFAVAAAFAEAAGLTVETTTPDGLTGWTR